MAYHRSFLGRPGGVALTYFVAGITWIAVTDYLVLWLADETAAMTMFQTAKGWVFVGGSTLLIFGVVRYSRGQLLESNERLDRALRQTSILHRVLRHNLRNNCTVIKGNTELLAETVPPAETECIEAIREQTDAVARLSEKSQVLRDIVAEPLDEPEAVSLVAMVDEVLALAERRYPAVDIDAEIDRAIDLETTPMLRRAMIELIENAIVHHPDSAPTIAVGVTRREDGHVALSVADDGTGLPEVEHTVLERGFETQLHHSKGLGLWIVQTAVTTAGGFLEIDDNEPQGTVVTAVV